MHESAASLHEMVHVGAVARASQPSAARARRQAYEQRCRCTEAVSVVRTTRYRRPSHQLDRRHMNMQLHVTAPRKKMAGHGKAWPCSSTRSHVDQDSPASTVAVEPTVLTCLYDASTTTRTLVELGAAWRRW